VPGADRAVPALDEGAGPDEEPIAALGWGSSALEHGHSDVLLFFVKHFDNITIILFNCFMDYSKILDLDRRAKSLGAGHSHHRRLFWVIKAETGRHLTGILGPRGSGKTILLQQLASKKEDACYLSADTLPRNSDLYAIVRDLAENYAFRAFFVDEIHYLNEGLADLKKIFDFLQVRLVFTSSVALKIHEAAHDLARRVRLHRLGYFSFREYLTVRHGFSGSEVGLEDLLQARVPAEHLRAADRFERYLTAGILPFALEEPDPLPLLNSTIGTIIRSDIPRFLRLAVDELETLEKMIAFIGRSPVDGINYSSLSSNLGITKYKAEQYVSALERAFVLQRLFPVGTNVLKEPKILLVPPLRLLHLPLKEARGALREDFFVFALEQAGLELSYLKGTRGQKIPDFLVRHGGQNLAFEIGGKGKGRSQFKGIQADRKVVFAEGAPLNRETVPLHLAGMLV